MKRLQNKLQRDKTQEAKELLAQDDMLTHANEDVANKLREEKEKHDSLLAGSLEIDEKVKLKKHKMEEDIKIVETQDNKLAELLALIAVEQKICDEQGLANDEAKKLNKIEEDKHRDLNQKFAALSAQLEFIEKGYDSYSSVKGINLEVFRSIMQTNQNVSKAVFKVLGQYHC